LNDVSEENADDSNCEGRKRGDESENFEVFHRRLVSLGGRTDGNRRFN
jgi:hypothetical protein